MNIIHNFTDGDSLIYSSYIIAKGDLCIYCGFMIDEEMQKMFEKLLDKYTIDSNIEEYESDLEFCYKILNKKHPCLTEEEFTIKRLLE